ncbi:hypothetical protein PV387_39380 [Streptomyces sp. ME02-6987-2C]|uniref:hypothetical protein n=1 Tax=unclassified Streptomyces TaxID=2593676 RepID=UPI0029B51F38|nr:MULTISPECIES: hypothetical protein [unclassified Streptomyces]MDX3345931.1 hypothetical protein [Streptomyces sp. ME02-6979A]MDX3371981.1 hypothetical protein [Streptomyces sp. ME02-6987-2C]MDX3421697.1 hypothetical protein [Streptomyces sp. ME02-6985-2c]
MGTHPTPTVVIARILRGLGLTQGRGQDFRVTGDYRNGERVGTYVLTLTRHADEVVAAHADEIEKRSEETGNSFRVSLRYSSSGRPVASVANYGSRVRETPPAPPAEEAPAPAPAPKPEPVPAPTPAKEASTPAEPLAERALEGARMRARRRANALGWSDRQAYLVAAAAAGALVHDHHGVLRDRPRPGCPGPAVDEARLTPLVKAGFVVVTEPFGAGHKRVSITADGRDALTLWRVYRPTPAVKDRKAEREPLRPLLDGEHAARHGRAAAQDDQRRAADAKAFRAAVEVRHAWEARQERLWKVWATVHGLTYRLGRTVPAGWVPTAEEIAEHRIALALVDELRAEAEHPAPEPELPPMRFHGPAEIAPLPAVPDEVEQLSLFTGAAA